MSRNRLPPSANPSEESEYEEEDEDEEGVEEEEQVAADEVNRKEAGSDEEEDLSAKTTSQVRGLDYGSDGDLGKTIPSPSVSDFVVKQNSKIEKEKEPKKRLSESDASRDKSQAKKAKREKKKGNVAGKDLSLEDKSKRSAGGQRIWGAEDEMKILTGILEYKQGTGLDFNSSLEAFYEFIKGSLNAVVDKNQLKNKIRKLKDKYRDTALKEANGKSPVFSKGHEAEAYEHSKKIWGVKSVCQGSKSKPKPKTEVSVDPNAPIIETDNVLALPVLELEVSKKKVISGSAKVASRARNRKWSRKMDLGGTDVEMKDYIIQMPAMEDNFMVKKGMELAEKSKVDALNDKWTKYQLELAQLYAKKLDLVMEHAKLILDALKYNP